MTYYMHTPRQPVTAYSAIRCSTTCERAGRLPRKAALALRALPPPAGFSCYYYIKLLFAAVLCLVIKDPVFWT